MDAKEAINILAKMQNYDSKENVEALEIAISALEKVETLEAENARLRENQMTDNRIKTIADANGISTILNKLTEECGELITAIARFQSKIANPTSEPEELFENLIEEAADTMIMIEQLWLQSPELFDDYKEAKINRQLERMGKQ